MKRNRILFLLGISFCCCFIICLSACFDINETANPESNQIFNIGDTFSFDGLEITVNSYTIESTYIYEDMFEADKGYDWAIVNISLTNKTTSTKFLEEKLLFSTSRVYATELVYNNDYKYNSTFFTVMGSYIPDIFIRAYDSIEPLATITGICAFKIPESISQIGKHEFIFRFNDSSDKHICKVLLQDLTGERDESTK